MRGAPFFQVQPRDEFHDETGLLVGDLEIENRDHVLMRPGFTQTREGLTFDFEPGERLLVTAAGRIEELQGHDAAGGGVSCLPHLPHRAGSDLLEVIETMTPAKRIKQGHGGRGRQNSAGCKRESWTQKGMFFAYW